ncbi:Lipase 4 [Cyphellophora attinorum]|uniref:Lipase 4 n=1 Tax=Cyphellophora attinorum TaxID=1664694 RepID=A0A0N1HAJ5_9EURO|nr:Lipase 4 [Phialophora attinorum]KPI39704.1 Lipase 4 [Phialophora attinorum]
MPLMRRWNFCADDLLEYDNYSVRIALLAARINLLGLSILSSPVDCVSAAARRLDEKCQTLLEQAYYEAKYGKGSRRRLKEIERQLLENKAKAETLKEDVETSKKLDLYQGHDDWKATHESIEPDYQPDVIRKHISALQDAVRSQNVQQIYSALQSALDRHLGGMDNIRLYKHSWFGTKSLIDVYNSTVKLTIEELVERMSLPSVTKADIVICRNTMQKALDNYGRTALSFSGGALLGMKHIASPKDCCSAGSIVAAVVATRTPSEMKDALLHFPDSNLSVFDAPASQNGTIAWCYRRLGTYWRTGSWFEPTYLERVMKEWLGDMTFIKAHNKTHRVLNIALSKASTAEPVILNYKTAPNVLIWSAVCASCAVPYGVFPGASVYEMDPATKQQRVWMENARAQKPFDYVDGSLDHDIPMQQLQRQFNVSWSIVAQTNPHVRAFLSPEERFEGIQPTSAELHPSMSQKVKSRVHASLVRVAHVAAECGFPPALWRWGAILTQQYTGDITILPDITWKEACTMVANPTAEFMRQATRDGERATWPKMARIRTTVEIELALERAIRDLNALIHLPEDGRQHRARSMRQERRAASPPHFLRSSSVGNRSPRTSIDESSGSDDRDQQDIKPGPLRRNSSLGSIVLPSEVTTGSLMPTVPLLAPQNGVNRMTFAMTPLDV